jgi:hypothetical protein
MASAIVHLQKQFMPGCIAAQSRDAQVEGSCRLHINLTRIAGMTMVPQLAGLVLMLAATLWQSRGQSM